MWPREGTIIRSLLRGLVIRLRNGAQIMLPHQKGLALGDTVFITWNFHTDKPANLLTHAEYHSGDEPLEPDVPFQLPNGWDNPATWEDHPTVNLGVSL